MRSILVSGNRREARLRVVPQPPSLLLGVLQARTRNRALLSMNSSLEKSGSTAAVAGENLAQARGEFWDAESRSPGSIRRIRASCGALLNTQRTKRRSDQSAHREYSSPVQTRPAKRFMRSATARAEVIRGLRAGVVDYAREAGADDEACQQVALAVSEALNNAVVHAYVGREVGPIHVEVWSDERDLFARIRDEGLGMVPRADSPGLGFGLPLMAQMADDLHVANRPDAAGTAVSLRFSLRRPEHTSSD